MLAVFALAVLKPAFKPLTRAVQERLVAHYDGYIPVLGGQQGKADATVVFTLANCAPLVTPPPPVPVTTPAPAPAQPGLSGGNGDASPAPAGQVVAPAAQAYGAKLTLVDFGIKFNGFSLPIQKENAKKFFPGAQFDFDSNGKLLGSNIPKVNVQFRLPGLDIGRIPELAFLPLNFPVEGLRMGQSFHNSANVDGTQIDLDITPVSQEGQILHFTFTRKERYSVLEDAGDSVVPDERDAVNKVDTSVNGTGTADFDLTQGRFTNVVSTDLAISQVTNLQSKEVSTRRLRRKFTLTAP